MNHFNFQFYTYRQTIKIILIMSKKTISVVIEIVKAIVYALSGFFGGNALM